MLSHRKSSTYSVLYRVPCLHRWPRPKKKKEDNDLIMHSPKKTCPKFDHIYYTLHTCMHVWKKIGDQAKIGLTLEVKNKWLVVGIITNAQPIYMLDMMICLFLSDRAKVLIIFIDLIMARLMCSISAPVFQTTTRISTTYFLLFWKSSAHHPDYKQVHLNVTACNGSDPQ